MTKRLSLSNLMGKRYLSNPQVESIQRRIARAQTAREKLIQEREKLDLERQAFLDRLDNLLDDLDDQDRMLKSRITELFQELDKLQRRKG